MMTYIFKILMKTKKLNIIKLRKFMNMQSQEKLMIFNIFKEIRSRLRDHKNHL